MPLLGRDSRRAAPLSPPRLRTLWGGGLPALCHPRHRETARGVLRAIVGARPVVVGLLLALVPVGAGLPPVAFAAVVLAVLVALVASEIARNLGVAESRPPEDEARGGRPEESRTAGGRGSRGAM